MGYKAELVAPPQIEQAIPVSYTHLRAHETDSYLVCRLLLEKIRALPGEPMSAEEIQAEIDAVRAERKARREAGR